MDDPNITMEEYIRIEEEKAQKHRKVFNWETAKYGKIWYDEDVLDLRPIEIEFLAIVFNETPSCEPTVVGYIDKIVHNFEQRLETIFGRQDNRVHILDFEGLTPDMRQDLAERMRMVCTRDDGQENEMGLDVVGALCFQLGGARRSMTWRQFILALGTVTPPK
ncbi:hypothetical protein Tco_0747411 [Tanacetum coccineum]|uniref:Uncharacterized protein n=1 Tax=Tanacetum coccineum TaxID=301880 RepID=A0ABQ4YTM7_9ASTR